MSIDLELGTKPEEPPVNVMAVPGRILMGHPDGSQIDMSMTDFNVMVKYVLTNTDLEPNDQRLQLVDCIRSMSVVQGHNSGRVRLQNRVPVIYDHNIKGRKTEQWESQHGG